MTGDEVRQMYEKMKSNNKIKVVINGVEIPYLSDYSFVDAKSFFKEPTRSASGVIENLNSYATFLTPRLKFSFKLMPIDTYRVLMKLIKEYNEFIVTVYDIVEDTYVTHKMYFHPKEFPAIYQNNLETLAILDESFELVGTNASLESISITYNSNGTTPELTSGAETYYGYEFVVGTYDEGLGTDPTLFERSGYNLDSWNTKKDGSGTKYITGATITPTSSMVLYAQWVATSNFVLSFDYQGGYNAVEPDLISKEVVQGTNVGKLPTSDELIKNGYTFGGWYIVSNPNESSTEITENTLYTYQRNITIYARWIGTAKEVIFYGNGGIGQMSHINTRVGETVVIPESAFTRAGYSFIKWNTLANGEGTDYYANSSALIDNYNLVLYAIWGKSYNLKYNTNGGINDNFTDYGVRFTKPIYTYKQGYKLAGWYFDAELSNPVNFPFSISTDTTIYASWEAIDE